MTNTISIINRNLYQRFPFHLVDPSNWPILVSFSLLNLTIGAVAYMHGYPNGGTIFSLGLILTVTGMVLWFRDVIVEGNTQNIEILCSSSVSASYSYNLYYNYYFKYITSSPPRESSVIMLVIGFQADIFQVYK